MRAVSEDAPAIPIHLSQPSACADFCVGAGNGVQFHCLDHPIAQSALPGKVGENMKHAMLLAGPQSHEQLIEVGVAPYRFSALEWHDEGVGGKDRVLHDRANLVRRVNDDK